MAVAIIWKYFSRDERHCNMRYPYFSSAAQAGPCSSVGSANELRVRPGRGRERVLAVLGGFLLLILMSPLVVPAQAQSKDRIVAVVNGEVITLKQLDNRVNSLMKTRQAAGMSRDTIKGKVLDALIDQELMNQAAKAKGVFVTDSDISMAMESIKKENNLSDAQFRASLAQSGTTEESFREDLRIELLRNRVLGAQVMSKIVITDSEVVSFLRGEGPDIGALGGGTGDERPLRMIVIPANPKNKAETMAQARKIVKEIEDGLDFGAAAKKYSKGPGRDKGGDADDGATVANLPPEMQAALATKKSGQPIDPADAGNAIVIFAPFGDPPAKPEPAQASGKSKKKKKGKAEPGEFTEEAMESARRQLERYKMQQRYVKWVEELKRNAIIRVSL